jgi:hypothetical protein
MDYAGDVAAIIVNRNRPDLTDALVEQLQALPSTNRARIIEIECGSDPDKRSRYANYTYDDPDFRGKCYGHNCGLDFVLGRHGRFRYYWFLMNDVVFEPGSDPIATLTEVLASEPRMALVSPTELDSVYPGSEPDAGQRWHMVSTCDYLALLMKDAAQREVGFLNPDFKYCWGAIHELSYKLYRDGWFLAYCDAVRMKHLGGTTYGAGTNTISRAQYRREAQRWAARYFLRTYGPRWDELFSQHLPPQITRNTYRAHRRFWESALPRAERERAQTVGAP